MQAKPYSTRRQQAISRCWDFHKVSPLLPSPMTTLLPVFYFDMHNIIALPVTLQQKTYLKRFRFPTWDLSRNSVYYSSPHLPPSCHASFSPIVTFFLILDLLTERTQGAKLMEISLYCHPSFILKTRLTPLSVTLCCHLCV